MWPSSTISALAGTCRSWVRQRATSVRFPRSRPANWYSESASGTGVTAASMVAGIRAQRDRHGKRLARMRQHVVAVVERAAAMGEPAHDDLVARDHLLAVDAQVLAALIRPARHGEPPRDERPRVARPAGLYGQAPEIHGCAFPHGLLARRIGDLPRRHRQHLLQERQLVPRVLPAARAAPAP